MKAKIIFSSLKRLTFTIVLFTSFLTTKAFPQEETRILRNPSISDSHIAFVYANDIWLSNHEGNNVKRLTTFEGAETEPHFSPDGSMIAFSGEYDGNTDVYIVPVSGGSPKRLTYHPSQDIVKGWTNDGTRIVFASTRTRMPNPILDQFWTVSKEGSFPQRFEVPRVVEGKLSPDGKLFAYQMIFPWESEFRNYRGGQNNPIRIVDMVSFDMEKIPWENSTDLCPVWIGNKVFFLSDRDHAMNIWSYDINTKNLNQETQYKDFDCKNLESNGKKLIYENGGFLYILNPEEQEPEKLSITVKGDFPWARPHWEKAEDYITDYGISPTGKRALFAARGDIFTIPNENGDIRNITNSTSSIERAPAWSVDGKYISWFSDESGEYQLVIADQFGEVNKKITLPSPTFYYSPVWSPDSKYISYTDADRNIWVVEVSTGLVNLIDNEQFTPPERTIFPEWSPDSKWIAYTKKLPSEYAAVFVYSIADKKSYQITDGMADSRTPAWDKSGKYIYFLSSTNYALNVGWLDMSSMRRPLERNIYMVILSKDDPSPLIPESDEEKNNKDKDKEGNGNSENITVNIDMENFMQRVVPLDIPEANYTDIQAADEGVIFFTENENMYGGNTLYKYTLKDKKREEIVQNVRSFKVSSDGNQILLSSRGSWEIFDAKKKPGDGKLKISDMTIYVNPVEEWKQIFREAWRFQRDYFYVENVHGLDLDWAYKTYFPWVDHVRHRSDLTYVLDILGGETSVGHSFTRGGDEPDIDYVPTGLLGADYEIANGRYRIKKIYNGESWNPQVNAPLAVPGIEVQEGDYILEVNGVEIIAEQNIYSYFEQLAGKQILIKVNDAPQLEGARSIEVIPVRNESALRRSYWVEENRRMVDKLSDGKLAYVWLPNTSFAGYQNFNRYYFAQQDKKGAIIDERYNGGGSAADYIVDLLARELMGYFNNPVGDKQPFTSPGAGIWGPKVMVINEMAGSGGDYLPYMFKKREIGPLVGTTTWGGLVGIWDVPRLIDGGSMTAPRGGFFNTDGEWDVENKGIAPDYKVEEHPKLVRQGIDPQLQKAIEVALKLLEEEKVELLEQPDDPVKVKRPE